MTDLCVTCKWLDQESRKRWEKEAKLAHGFDEDHVPQFNARYAYCTNPRNKRQPKTDMVAGIHLDGAPWLTCREVRRLYPICPDWKERQENEQS